MKKTSLLTPSAPSNKLVELNNGKLCQDQETTLTVAGDLYSLITALGKTKAQIKKLKDKETAQMAELVEALRNLEIRRIEDDALVVTHVPATVRTTVDTSKLKTEHPRIYKQCIREMAVKESVKLRFK